MRSSRGFAVFVTGGLCFRDAVRVIIIQGIAKALQTGTEE